MQKITIKTIPDTHQRYNTVGDYYRDENGDQIFLVSDMNNWKYEFLVALHELVESALCHDRGITDQMIDEFDFAFEKCRESGEGESEPGNQPDAPYFKEHKFATQIEQMMAKELNVEWNQYLEVCNKLDKNQEVL